MPLTTPLTVSLCGGSTFCGTSFLLVTIPFHRPRGPETQEWDVDTETQEPNRRAVEGPALLSASQGKSGPCGVPGATHPYLPAAWSRGPVEPPLPWTGPPYCAPASTPPSLCSRPNRRLCPPTSSVEALTLTVMAFGGGASALEVIRFG